MLFEISKAGQISGASVQPLPGVPARVSFATTTPQVDNGQVIAIQPVTSQQLNVTLGGQACTIKLYYKSTYIPYAAEIVTIPPLYIPIQGCFLDLYLNDSLLIGGVLVMDRNLIVRNSYLGFVGDLAMMDTLGSSDPTIDGLGTRYLLVYWPNLA